MGVKIKFPSFMYDTRFILAALFIFSIIIRLIYKNAGLWHFDSYADAKTVEDILTTGTMQYSYAYGAPAMVVTVFIFYYLQHLITGIMTAEPAYFFVTFVSAALGVCLLYLITEKLTKNKFISVSAAFLFSVTPIFLSVTVYPKTHALSIFYALLGGYLMMISADKDSMKLLALSGLFFGLNIAIRPDGVLYILPFLLLYINPRIKNKKLILNKSRLSIKNALVFGIPMIAIWLILFMPRIIELGGFGKFLASNNPTTETRGGWLGIYSPKTIPALLDLTFSVTLIGWIFCIAGLIYFYKNKINLELITLMGWFLGFFLIFGNIAGYHSRFLLPALIPVMIFIAAGCSYVYKRHALVGIGLVLLLMGTMIYAIHPVIGYRHLHSGTKDFAMFVAQKTPSNAIVMTNDLGFFVQYYGHREIIFHPRTGNLNEINDFIIQLMDYSKKGRPVFATEEGFGIDPGQLVQNAILANFDVQLVGEAQTEWYGDGTLKLALYNQKLFYLSPKKYNSTENEA